MRCIPIPSTRAMAPCGPQDRHLQDSLGRAAVRHVFRTHLLERFDMTYTGPDGEKHRPVMIHRTVLGSMERFIGILTEHFGGAFPLWLSPVQARILTITERADAAAKALKAEMEKAGLRVELDLRNEKIGFKVREAQLMKIPYMLVIGDRSRGGHSVRAQRKGQAFNGITHERLIATLKAEEASKATDKATPLNSDSGQISIHN